MVTTEFMVEIPVSHSDFDKTTSETMANDLTTLAGNVYGSHYSDNFYGKVFYYDGLFYDEIWKNGEVIALFSDKSLDGLFAEVAVSDRLPF